MARPQQQSRGNQQPTGRVRSLRVGIILGGKIVEERLIRKRETISIGQSSKNTFSVPVEGLPRTWPLFTEQGGKFFLNFTTAMGGRISDGSGVRTLDSLRGNEARQHDGGFLIPLAESSRGKIVVGEMTLLFQFVSAPPLQPRPRLPAAVRGSLADRIDPHLAIVLGCSMVAHLAVIIIALQYDPPKSRYEKIYSETFNPTTTKIDTFKQPQTPKTTDDDSAKKKPDDTAKKPTKKPTSKKPSKKPSGKPSGKKADSGSSKMSAEQVRDQVTRRVNDLFSDDETKAGRRGGMNAKKPGEDIAKVADEIKKRGDKIEQGGGKNRGPRGSGGRKIGTTKGPNVKGPGTTTKAPRTKEKIVKSRVKLGGARSSDQTTLTPAMVLRKIRGVYMRGLQGCHKQVLKKDPTAGGRVTLRFTVNSSGRTTGVSIKGFHGTVDSCIGARVRGWRFPKPKEDGDAVSAQFSITLQLRPS